jgi:hypothetical protein
MGVVARRPTLPAPTESLIESAEESNTPTDLATDISRQTDQTSHTIPDDGTPITLPTGRKRSTSSKLTKSPPSQTSLLIEYFEAGNGQSVKSRPSVRVKVHPSGSRKNKDKQEGELVVTKSHGNRKSSFSRRISFGTDSPGHPVGAGSISSLDSEFVPGRGIEIEVLPREESELSGTSVSREARYIVPPSDISSMPADSMLGESTSAPIAPMGQGGTSRGVVGEEAVGTDTLKAPFYDRDRSLSRERLTEKVIEKLRNKPGETSSGSGRRRHGEKSKSRSASKELVEAETKSPRRKSGKHRDEESTTGAESSLVSNSLLSANRKSGDQYSFRSGTSKSSINNPKLLETVEDAIRRLILPELKELKKDQKSASNRYKFERDIEASNTSGSSASREQTARRVSKHGSAPEMKPSVVPHRDSKEAREPLSRGSRHRERRRKDADFDSASERSYSRRESGDSLSVDEGRGHHKKGKSRRVRDVAAGAMIGGALTAAALRHHDSRSDVDQRERRKKRSKSRSRSTSVAESEEIFEKHEVPPMPMRSEVDSELTRSSLLSQQTADTTTPTHREVKEVVSGSPLEVQSRRELQSSAARTPKSDPVDLRKGLSTHHGNLSSRDLSAQKEDTDIDAGQPRHLDIARAAIEAAAGGAGVLASERFIDDDERVRAYENNLHHQHPIRRGLSPIQSVASYTTTEPNRNSVMHTRSGESLSSVNEEHQVRNELSIDSLSSAPSTDVARSKRPAGISLENRSEILGQHSPSPLKAARDLDSDNFYDEQHSENERYRDSYASSDPKIDVQRMTNYTDDSMDAPYLDKVTAGQQVARGWGANPEYVYTPPGVESAVASLYDPSLADGYGSQSPHQSYTGSSGPRDLGSPASLNRDVHARETGSPLKQQYLPISHHEKSSETQIGTISPPRDIAKSFEEDQGEPRVASATSPLAETGLTEKGPSAESPTSEITTNPSVIQGPIGGTQRGNLDHWPYNETPPRSRGEPPSVQSRSHDLGVAEAAAITGTALGVGLTAMGADKNLPAGYESHNNKDMVDRDLYPNSPPVPPSPGYKDEGYITGDNPRSPGLNTPDIKNRRANAYAYANDTRDIDVTAFDEDPFSNKHNRHLSGLSHGMGSPLYDSASGRGLDRIQSKDIVALMDHLTVRDAQRNARDTEILVTLVRSAAEMRNSFEDMKKFIAEQDDLIMDEAERLHDKTQKIIGGPRPQPLAASRFPRRTISEEEEDMRTKRQSVFKRALKGLGSKNSNELQNIEAMLVQLLGDVENLRSIQTGQNTSNSIQPPSLNSVDHARAPTDTGYEPEGQAGTSSTGDRSGFFSNNSSRQADHWAQGSGRRESGNRVSTVMEGDEDLEASEPNQQSAKDLQNAKGTSVQSPIRNIRAEREVPRGVSEPLATPPRMQQPTGGTSSYENTPRMSSDGKTERRRKSISSSFFPKISRWSKTTASSIGDNFRGTSSKTRAYSQASQSGEHVDDFAYDPHGDDRLRSNNSLANEQYQGQEIRPPSPLIPSQVSDNPKYQAHRNSLNLQHPQPRQGPTGRYQHQLETEAQNYGEDPFSPASQTSSQWEHQGGVLAPVDMNTSATHRYEHGGHLSPISDAGYSETSSAMMDINKGQHEGSLRSISSRSSMGNAGPPRPPKILDNEPLVPQRPPKIAMNAAAGRQATYVDHVNAARSGSPAYDKV